MRNFFKGFWEYLKNWAWSLFAMALWMFVGIVISLFCVWYGIIGTGPVFMIDPKFIDFLREAADKSEELRKKRLEEEIENEEN